MLREALAMCRGDAGTQFCGPKVISALVRATDDPAEQTGLLAEGEALLRRGSVGHNHLWFYRDAIEAMLGAGNGAGVLRYVTALQVYTQAEPLPWSDLFAERGRVLATGLAGGGSMCAMLIRIRASLEGVGLSAFVPRVDAAPRLMR